ncbi:hypothetical protein E8E12_009318 [Didymella heteroderae]|uniref:N-acetyltransferase domain-containing protein n=1 Tax=Didymella heteroderae TaxID=1769908 RepID=A0A9P5C2B4_9PLEO|nr:hypothetical protein E8E12_009318 [Didymella heteroderae]
MPPEALSFDPYSTASVTEDVMREAAALFSEEYGIWGPRAEEMGRWCEPGVRIKMSRLKLRQQSLSPGTDSVLVCCRDNGGLVGHAFVTRWDDGATRVCWVTQLCVRKEYRLRGVATALLKHLKHNDDHVFGILSSHPAALMALLRALGPGLEAVDLDFMREHAQNVLVTSPVDAIKWLVIKFYKQLEMGEVAELVMAPG